mgnify:CR=1 FL=1
MRNNKQIASEDVLLIPIAEQIEKTRSAEPTQRTTSDSEEDRCEGEVEKNLVDALHQSVSSSKGTLLSNTVTQYPITAIMSISSF